MKKRLVSFISLVMVLLMALSTVTIAAADEGAVVGGAENDAAFWTVFSDVYAVPAGQTVTTEFTNYTDGATNWNNFLVVLQNTPSGHSAAEAEGYAEYAVVRADNFGWGAGYGTAILESNWDWSTFTDDMNGAKVVMSVTNYGDGYADILCNITTADGAEHFQNYKMITVTGDLYFCITVEKAHVEITKLPEAGAIPAEQLAEHNALTVSAKAAADAAAEKAKIQEEEAAALLEEELAEEVSFEGLNTNAWIGKSDFSTGWWGDHSEIFPVKEDSEASVKFISHSPDNATNWNNFAVVLQNTPTGHSAAEAEGYAEYAVVRADNYGWGSGYSAALLQNDWNWDTFKADIDDANVQVQVFNNGDTADVLIRATSTEGDEHYQLYKGVAISGDLYFCLTVDTSYLEILGTGDPVEDPTEPAEQDPSEEGSEVEVVSIASTVGATDNSTGFWGAHSEIWEVKSGESIKRSFVNYSNMVENWNNFLVILQSTPTGHGQDTEGYSEYAVLRSDNYGWGSGFENSDANKASNWDWANYKDFMDGAEVVVTVTNENNVATVRADCTKDEETHFQEYKNITVDSDKLYVCFTVDGSHLEPVEASV